ncbi:MAG: helix-turn-helix domain-containing protein [Egibacteraceae bacterium]
MSRLAAGAPGPERQSRRSQGSTAFSPLQRERLARGWSQTRLIAELQNVAVREGYILPTNGSLTAMVSRWENGHCEPDVLYRYLLCEVYGKTAAQLGFGDDQPEDQDQRTWLTMEDFCRELEVPYSTAYKWSSFGSASGRFPQCRRLPNGKIRIRRVDLEEWLDGLPTL